MVDQTSRPRSVKKYVIAGGIGAVVLVGVLVAVSYMSQPKISNTSGSVTPIPQGNTPGAGKDNPGPTDGGGMPDTTSKPIPDVTPTAAISVSPNPAAKAGTVNVEGSGFNGTQTITLMLNGDPVKTEPAQLKTDSAGNFSTKFTLLDGQTGDLKLAAIDESGNKALTTLSVRQS